MLKLRKERNDLQYGLWPEELTTDVKTKKQNPTPEKVKSHPNGRGWRLRGFSIAMNRLQA